MKILSLDISSHTGWAVIEDNKLLHYGKIDIQCEDSSWPLGILNWSKEISSKIFDLINNTECDKIIIERANSSRFRNSQNFLDWVHFDLINTLVDEGYYEKLLYRDSSLWRKLVGIKLTKDQKKQNKMAKAASKKKQILKVNGKRAGKVTKKHLAILKCNEVFQTNFKLKENDIAEACLLGYSYFIQQ